jgi:hypothetical protein
LTYNTACITYEGLPCLTYSLRVGVKNMHSSSGWAVTRRTDPSFSPGVGLPQGRIGSLETICFNIMLMNYIF